MAGLWTHRDIVSDTFTFLDLLDAHEALDVKHENDLRMRAHDAQQQRLLHGT